MRHSAVLPVVLRSEKIPEKLFVLLLRRSLTRSAHHRRQCGDRWRPTHCERRVFRKRVDGIVRRRDSRRRRCCFDSKSDNRSRRRERVPRHHLRSACGGVGVALAPLSSTTRWGFSLRPPLDSLFGRCNVGEEGEKWSWSASSVVVVFLVNAVFIGARSSETTFVWCAPMHILFWSSRAEDTHCTLHRATADIEYSASSATMPFLCESGVLLD